MNSKDDTTPSLLNRVTYKLTLLFKDNYQRFLSRRDCPKTVVFILGCQRSGTSIMTRIFERDFKAKVYGEYSELSSDDPEGLRLNALESVQERFDSLAASLIVAKPLVESQNADRLLSFFHNSRVLWLYRHYKDVTLSNIIKFTGQNCINNITPIMLNDHQNWRAERVPQHVREIILKYYSGDMRPADAAALFWFVRNSIFFDLELNKSPSVMMITYDELVSEPRDAMERIYRFIGREFPRGGIVTEVHSKSKGKGKHVELSPEIEEVCRALWIKLNSNKKVLLRSMK